MDKEIQITIMYEIYKELLTKTMREIFELYYYSNLSLREIGELKKISYQAVSDTLKKVEKQLLDFESKLKMCITKQEIMKLNGILSSDKPDLNKIKEIVNKLGDM